MVGNLHSAARTRVANGVRTASAQAASRRQRAFGQFGGLILGSLVPWAASQYRLAPGLHRHLYVASIAPTRQIWCLISHPYRQVAAWLKKPWIVVPVRRCAPGLIHQTDYTLKRQEARLRTPDLDRFGRQLSVRWEELQTCLSLKPLTPTCTDRSAANVTSGSAQGSFGQQLWYITQACKHNSRQSRRRTDLVSTTLARKGRSLRWIHQLK
jgi:hypothetical protein